MVVQQLTEGEIDRGVGERERERKGGETEHLPRMVTLMAVQQQRSVDVQETDGVHNRPWMTSDFERNEAANRHKCYIYIR